MSDRKGIFEVQTTPEARERFARLAACGRLTSHCERKPEEAMEFFRLLKEEGHFGMLVDAFDSNKAEHPLIKGLAFKGQAKALVEFLRDLDTSEPEQLAIKVAACNDRDAIHELVLAGQGQEIIYDLGYLNVHKPEQRSLLEIALKHGKKSLVEKGFGKAVEQLESKLNGTDAILSKPTHIELRGGKRSRSTVRNHHTNFVPRTERGFAEPINFGP